MLLGAVRRRSRRRAPGGSVGGSADGADRRTRHRHVGQHRRRHSTLRGRSGARERPHLGTLRFDVALGRGAPGRSPRRRRRAPRDPVPGRDPWVRRLPACAGLPVGYFGAGTAGVAAMWPLPRTPRSVRWWRGTAGWSWRAQSPPGGLRTHAAHRRHRGPGGTAGEGAVRTPVAVRTSHRRGPRRRRTRDGHDQSDDGDRLAREWFADHLGRAPAAGPSVV